VKYVVLNQGCVWRCRVFVHRSPSCKTDDVKRRQRHGVEDAECRAHVSGCQVVRGGGATNGRGWVDGSLVRVVRMMFVHHWPPLGCM